MPHLPGCDVLEFYQLGSYPTVPVGRARFYSGQSSLRACYIDDPDRITGYGALGQPQTAPRDLPSIILGHLASRVEWPWKPLSTEDEIRQYRVSLNESFERASHNYPSVTINPDVMAGAPCIEGTRIPVYMVLDAIEYYGEFGTALRSYPSLTIQQVKDAIGFAKLVVECPIEDESTPSAG